MPSNTTAAMPPASSVLFTFSLMPALVTPGSATISAFFAPSALASAGSDASAPAP